MVGTAGRRALVKVAGAAVTMTDEACTDTGDHLTFQITDATRRAVAAQASATVKIGGVAQSASTFSLNRLNGKITFTSSHAGASVTISSQYLPLSVAAGCRTFNWQLVGTNGDDSDYDNVNSAGGFALRIQAAVDAKGSLTRRFRNSDTVLSAAVQAGVPVVIEFYADRAQAFDLRVWALLNKIQYDAAHESVQEQSVDWEGAADADGRAASVA